MVVRHVEHMQLWHGGKYLKHLWNSLNGQVTGSLNKLEEPILGKTLGTISAVQMDFVQIAFQPPHPQATGPFGATFFAEN